jgi:hypothetical protein
MKLFIKLMIFMVFMAMAGPFLLKGPDGKPLLTLQKLGVPSLSQLIARARNTIPSAITATDDPAHAAARPASRANTFYKWQDANGVWQFTTEPPPQPITYNEIHTDPQANIIQSLPKDTISKTLGFAAPEPVHNKPADGTQPAAAESGLTATTIPVSQIPQLIDDAKKAREVMDQHQQSLDEVIEEAEGGGSQDRFPKRRL